MTPRILNVMLIVIILALSTPAHADLVRFEIKSREPFADGKSFGEVGAYERIVGRAHYEFDPKLPQNQNVVDLKLAPRNKRGHVEVTADLFLLAPRDLTKASGAALYDVNNRGNKLALRFFNFGSGSNNPTSAVHAGDGFLMRHGFVVVWSGWDGELLPGGDRLRLGAPIAKEKTITITGKVRCEIYPHSGGKRAVINWGNHGAYRPTAKGLGEATLTHRVRPGEPRVPVSPGKWKLHITEVESDLPGQLPKIEIEMPEGMQKGHIYELIYEAQNPRVMGVCFPAVRDLMSALKNGTGQDNPLLLKGKPVVKRAHAFGVSQSGRFLREMLYWGFNEDEAGRQVLDGVIPHVSGSGLGSFNHRFAQPTRHASQHDHHDYPPDRFPFSYGSQRDPFSGQHDGILKRCQASGTTPIVLHTQSEAEYWTRSGSLTHTDPLGRKDFENPEAVRIYLFGGTQHGPGGWPPSTGDGKTLSNPGDYRPFLRALLLGLDRTVASRKSGENTDHLPPSIFPTIAAGTLVDGKQDSTGFPKIPGILYPKIIQQPQFLDFGPRWQEQRIIDRQPPMPRGDYRVLAPRCDEDGNVRGCLLPTEVAVPVATYTGWNLRNAAAGAENDLVSLRGSFIPFPKTKAEQEKSGDPRRSIEERYETQREYLRQLKTACVTLQKAGYLLEEDIDRTLRIQQDRTADLFE